MKRLALAAAAVALAAPGANAATGTCVDLADPAGDVRLHPALPALPAGVVRDVDALDIVAVRAEAVTGDSISATFTLAEGVYPQPGMRYGYAMHFSDATYDYRMTVAVDELGGYPVTKGVYQLEVTVRASGQTWSYDIVGGSYGREVSVTAFGSRAPILQLDPDAELTITGFSSWVGPNEAHGPVDEVAGNHTLVVGAGCP